MSKSVSTLAFQKALLHAPIKTIREWFVDAWTSVNNTSAGQVRQLLKNDDYAELLTDRWYAALPDIERAYKVYNDRYYCVDIWMCFARYSRTYLRALTRPTKTNSTPFVEMVADEIRGVADVGCGPGLTSATLGGMFPDAKISCTNLKNTDQWNFITRMSEFFGIENLKPSVHEINHPVDLVFASEYFEHHIAPIEHVREIIDAVSPRYFVIANAFNTRSIGHFITYTVDGEPVDQSKMSRLFGRTMRDAGYQQVKMGHFNNKPHVWKRQ